MAIDRAPWNALVDDDGSNLIGSLWNKAAINTVLLNPIDALVGTRVDVAYSAANYGPEAGVWTVSAGHQITYSYTITAKLVQLVVYLYGTDLSGAATSALRIYHPCGVTAKDVGGPVPYTGPAIGTGVALAGAGTTYLRVLRDIAGTPWPVGPVNMIVNLAFWIQ